MAPVLELSFLSQKSLRYLDMRLSLPPLIVNSASRAYSGKEVLLIAVQLSILTNAK